MPGTPMGPGNPLGPMGPMGPGQQTTFWPQQELSRQGSQGLQM